MRASRAARAMTFAMLAGCFGEPVDPETLVYDGSCIVFATCDTTGDGIVIPIEGTHYDIEQIAQGWVDSCAVITEEWITSGRCTAVFCGAFCDATNGGTS